MNPRNYQPEKIQDIVFKQIDYRVKLEGIIRGMVHTMDDLEHSPYSNYSFALRAHGNGHQLSYVMVNFRLRTSLNEEELANLPYQSIQSLFLTAHQDELTAVVYGKAFPNESIPKLEAHAVSILGVEIGNLTEDP